MVYLYQKINWWIYNWSEGEKKPKKQEQRVISFFAKKRRERVRVVMKVDLSGKLIWKKKKKSEAFNASPNIERVKWINEFD